MISEIGCAESLSQSKAEWVEDAFQKANEIPRLKLLVWFNFDKRREGEEDWRIDSSAESLKIFNTSIERTPDLDTFKYSE